MKKIIIAFVAIPYFLMLATFASADSQLEKNKKLVVDMYTKVIFNRDTSVVDQYIKEDYIQHNPLAKTGRAALVEFLDSLAPLPEGVPPDGEIVRVIAEGDYVVLHVKYATFPPPNGTAVVDIFRIEDGLVAEHWDVMQAVPATSANDNTMF